MNQIRLLIVEDDPGWVKSMTAFLNLEEDLLVAGTAATAEAALKLAQAQHFDVILMDIQLEGGGQDGIYAAAQLHAMRTTPVIMLTSLQNEDAIRQSFSAGAANYVDKTDYAVLPQAIRDAHYQRGTMNVLVQELARLQRAEQLGKLTAAEREIYELFEAGYTHAQIEQQLHKAEQTIKNQVNKLLKKLGAPSMREAIHRVRSGGVLGQDKKQELE